MEILFRPEADWEGHAPARCLKLARGGPAPALAKAVLAHGTDRLTTLGDPPYARLLVGIYPSLDHLVALWLLGREEVSEAERPAVEALCEYAAAARQGIPLGQAPPERAVRSVAEELRRAAGDLTEVDHGEHLLERTKALFEAVLQRMIAGEDLLGPDPMASVPGFAPELALLARDRSVYLDDRSKGRAFLATMPDGSTRDLLFLEDPRSNRFKEFARADEESPLGGGFGLMAVWFAGPGAWVISSDPLIREPVGFLAEALQAAESAKSPSAGTWYAGERHGGTLVGSPKQGTALTRDEVLAVLTEQLSLREPVVVPAWRGGLKWVGSAVVIGLALVGIVGVVPALMSGMDEPITPEQRAYHEEMDAYLSRGPEVVGEDTVTTSLQRQGKDRALIFATDTYDHWRDLANPTLDAKVIQTELETYYGFEVELVSNPTVQQIKEKLDDELNRKGVHPHDQLLVFVAGHGYYDKKRDRGYIVGKDSEQPERDKTRSTYLSQREFIDSLDALPTEHVLVVMDTCFGGAEFLKMGHRGEEEEDYAKVDVDAYVSRKLGYKTRLFVTSSRKETVSDGMAGRHSPFAYHLLRALRRDGGPLSDGLMTHSELVSELELGESEIFAGDFGSNAAGADFLLVLQKADEEPVVAQ